MKLNTREKKLLVAALSHGIARAASVQGREEYRRLRTKIERAMRDG